jgi:hypothetical protein
MDSLIKLAENPADYVPYENESDTAYAIKIQTRSIDIMGEYNRQKMHLIDRDSTTINNILQQLTYSYTSMLYKYGFNSRLPNEFKSTLHKLHGEWEFLIIGGGFTFEKNNSGTLTLDDGHTRRGFWSLDKDYKFVLATDPADSIFTFKVLNVTDRNIRLAINDSLQVIGFRRNY